MVTLQVAKWTDETVYTCGACAQRRGTKAGARHAKPVPAAGSNSAAAQSAKALFSRSAPSGVAQSARDLTWYCYSIVL